MSNQNIALKFVKKVIEVGSVSDEVIIILRNKDVFKDIERPVVSYVMNYFDAYDSFPPLQLVVDEFPVIGQISTDYDLAYLIDQLKIRYVRDVVRETTRSINRSVESSDETEFSSDWVRELQGAVEVVNSSLVDNRVVSYSASAQERLQMFEDIKNGVREAFFATGHEAFDRVLGGLVPGRLYIIYGRPANYKTTSAISLCMKNIISSKDIGLVLFSGESSINDLSIRLDSMLAGIDWDRLLRGDLNVTEESRYREFMKRIKENPYNIVLPNIRRRNFLAEVEAMMRNMSQKVFLFDSLYEYCNRKWDELSEVLSALNNLALEHNKVVLITTQQKPNEESAAYADAFEQVGSLNFSISKLRPGSSIMTIKKSRYTAGEESILFECNPVNGYYNFKTNTVVPQSAINRLGNNLPPKVDHDYI